MNLSDLFTTIPLRKRVLGLFCMCIMLCVCTSNKALAQLSAAFTATPTGGCTPLIVAFSDQSTGSPVSWKWDLGNGNTSSLQNPSAAYFTTGSYTVKLVVTDASGHTDSVTKTQYITVYPNPVAAFIANDTTGCLPLNIGFTDQSTASGNAIAQWKWDFGDGNTSALQNPSHTYMAAGAFNVTLQVTSTYGCVATLTKPKYINIPALDSANFTATSVFTCRAPDTVTFTNTTTGPAGPAFQWNFGDNTSATTAAPTHIYTAPGSYNVTLIATSQTGCPDTLTRPAYINIGNLQASFTNSPQGGCINHPISFHNTTTAQPDSLLWRFGDGGTSKTQNPIHTYTQAGAYTVTLVEYAKGCSDSVSQTVTVTAAPTGSFNADKTSGCSTPFTVNFTATATNATSYYWDFGDGTNSGSALPPPQGQTQAHTYTAYGTYTVKLVLTNAGGCVDTLSQTGYIKVTAPVIKLTGLPATGCIPYTLTPTATVTSSDPVTGYLWNFGDGATSTVANPSHNYTTQGTYNVALTVTTASGCSATVEDTAAVKVGTLPATAFVASPTVSCVGKLIQFTDQTPGPVDTWEWYMAGGGTPTANTKDPEYSYSTAGTYTVKLVTGNNGCFDSSTRTQYITIEPPQAAFVTLLSCGSRMARSFTDKSVGATTWLWNFGDGTTSIVESPQHTFAAPGQYTVSLTVTNGSCTETTTQQVDVIYANPAIQVSGAPVCKGSAETFSLPSLDSTTIQSIVWNFGDGTTATYKNQKTAFHTYTAAGTYTVSVTVTDLNGCDTSASIPNAVTVNGPTASFTLSASQICVGATLTATDHSTTDGTHSIVSWIWNFGDGTIDSALTPPYTHVYTQGSSTDVTLTVRDAGGCVDSAKQGLIVSSPVANFTAPDTIVCAGNPISFINQSTGGIATEYYTWTFGDGTGTTTTNTAISPSHVYTKAGQDTVTLSIKDAIGCTSSLVRPAYIDVQIPVAAFTASATVSYCPPLDVQFTNQSSSYSTVAWNFGDGNTSTEVNPLHFYSYPGVYIVTMTVTGSGGCTASANDTITIYGPTGTFTYNPTTGCDSLTTHFSVASDSSVAFVWDYGNGQTQSVTQNTSVYTYTDTGTYIPRVILVSATGCKVPITGSQAIHVYRVKAGAQIGSSKACGSGIVQFQDASVSNDQISAFYWDFGDGSNSTEQNPFHTYTQPGTYTLTHVAITANGCADTIVFADTIHIFQPPVVQIRGDSAGCVPDTLSFTAVVTTGNPAALQYQWNFGNGQTAVTQNPPPAIYPTAGNYNLSLVVADNNGCTDSTSETVLIHPLPVVSAGGPYIVCLGTPVTLQPSGADHYTWSPAQYLSCTNCTNPQANPPQNTEYYVTGYTVYGCSAQDSAAARVFFPDTVQVNGDTSLCLGAYYHLEASGAYAYSWSPTTGLTNPESASTYATPPVTTTYTVTGTDSAHCFTDSKNVTITVLPVPTVQAGPDVTGSAGTPATIPITNSGDVVSWSWTPPNGLSCDTCPDPMASPANSTQYTVTVRNAAGCTAQDTVTVFITCNNGNIFLPNTFSPNGDGMNDVFYPRGKGISLVKSLRIFNRWGQLVFERDNFPINDRSAGWDGTYGGQKLSPDAYIYLCDVICENNAEIQLKGDVTLLR